MSEDCKIQAYYCYLGLMPELVTIVGKVKVQFDDDSITTVDANKLTPVEMTEVYEA